MGASLKITLLYQPTKITVFKNMILFLFLHLSCFVLRMWSCVSFPSLHSSEHCFRYAVWRWRHGVLKWFFFPWVKFYFGPQFGLGDRVSQDLASQVRSWEFYPFLLVPRSFLAESPPPPPFWGALYLCFLVFLSLCGSQPSAFWHFFPVSLMHVSSTLTTISEL